MAGEPTVLITGTACATSLGLSKTELVCGIRQRKSGLRAEYGHVRDLAIANVGIIDVDTPVLRRYGPTNGDFLGRLLCHLVEQALADACVELPLDADDTVTMIIGTTYGNRLDYFGLLALREDPTLYKTLPVVDELRRFRYREDDVTAQLERHLGCAIQKLTVGMQCASSILAVACAASLIRRGAASRVLVAAYDLFDPLCYYVLRKNGLISEKLSEALGVSHQGFNVADGAAVMVLESAEHVARRSAAVPYGKVSGWAMGCCPSDGEPSLRETCRIIEAALAHADMSVDDIDLISPHACAVPVMDQCESLALRRVFGGRMENVPVAIYSGYTGYTFAASGYLDLIVALEGMRSRTLFGGSGPSSPDPISNFRFVRNEVKDVSVQSILKLKLAYSGALAGLVVSAVS